VRFKKKKSMVALSLLLGMLALSTGCSFGRGNVVSFVAGVIVDRLLGLPSQSIVIERNCFENGQPVDCSQIPSM